MDCYSDRKEDRVMTDMYVDPDMTQAACRSHCEGYMYYGTQVGGAGGGVPAVVNNVLSFFSCYPTTIPYVEIYIQRRNMAQGDRYFYHTINNVISPCASLLPVQYGNECWCGNSDTFTDYDKHGAGTCHMPCAGDKTVACGEERSHIHRIPVQS